VTSLRIRVHVNCCKTAIKKTVTGSGLVTVFIFKAAEVKPLTTLSLDAAKYADDEDGNADKDVNGF
jgi:hypothetical protein